MRQFYLSFPIVAALRQQLSWSHYKLILNTDKKNIREFYLNESIENQWSTRQLERQINSKLYERMLLSKDKKGVLQHANKQEKPMEASDIIKDPYILDFLNLKDSKRVLESDLEHAIIDKLQDFILELGKGFAFVARQKRITVGGDHFYIDLVFYNYHLRCFLLIDLKTGKLSHQDIGQIDFYVRYYEENYKLEGDNPAIGLVLCTEKNEAMVHYSVLNESKQLFASKYKLYLPSEKELKNEVERKMLEFRTNEARR